MHGNLNAKTNGTTNADGTSDAEKTDCGKSDADWFRDVVAALLPHKAGMALHYTTGLGDVRLCQKYAAGSVKPPAFFLRALLRDQSGWQWLCGTMDGCTAPWWLEVQDAMKMKRAIDSVK